MEEISLFLTVAGFAATSSIAATLSFRLFPQQRGISRSGLQGVCFNSEYNCSSAISLQYAWRGDGNSSYKSTQCLRSCDKVFFFSLLFIVIVVVMMNLFYYCYDKHHY
jgi:hypothetical protein